MGALYESENIHLQTWQDTTLFTQTIGEKAARLLALPRPWCPRFAALSYDNCQKILLESGEGTRLLDDELLPVAVKLLQDSGALIIRSSVVGETIWDRGTYESIVVAPRGASLKSDLVDAIRRVIASAHGLPCAIIMQSHFNPSEMGEFGNLMRVSKTRDQWELSVRTDDEVKQSDRYNSQRDEAPDKTNPLMARAGLQRERLFGAISAWINNELLRGTRARVNCEWIRHGERFFVVQIDSEDDDLFGVNPMQIYIEPSLPVGGEDGAFLKIANEVSRKTWDKLSVLDELFGDDSEFVPRLFFVPLSELIGDDIEQKLKSDFERLIERNIVVRTSVRTGSEKITNLPKTDCMSPDQATSWCVETAVTLSQQHDGVALAFVAHRYIAARSSAWVRVNPAEPTVEIHGTWGLPDALQFCPYDIWEVHVPTEEIIEYPNYKSNVLLLQDDGSWKYERTKNEISRFQSIGSVDILEISRRSLDLAQKLGCPCHIMWFVGCVAADGTIRNLPWYWTKAHQTENPERGNLQIFSVKGDNDLAKLPAMQKKYRRLAISLKPRSVELLRDNDFLSRVSNAVIPMNIPVLLYGSTLAHAFYQLRKNGCTVISELDKDHQRTRKQTVFGKLVRDKIPDKIASQKEKQSVSTIPTSLRNGFLIGKILEEVLEVREAKNSKDQRTELADVFEVFRSLANAFDEKLEDIFVEADKKRDRVGGFAGGKILLQTSLPKAGESFDVRDDSISAEMIGGTISDKTFRIPFAYFGFAEIGHQRVLDFPQLGVSAIIVLQRDCLELTLVRAPEQLRLDLESGSQ